jgi:hypothetical protein
MPQKPRRVVFVVSFDLPPGETVTGAQAYVYDAVRSMKGGLQPPGYGPGGYDPEESGDPMFGLNGDTVQVKRFRQSRKERT